MKKIISILLCLLLILPVTVQADQSKVTDDAHLLSSGELSDLEEKAQAIALEFEMDVVIYTVDSLDGMAIFPYADHYYDTSGYGYGSDQSGIIFLLAMEEREYAIRTIGLVKQAISDPEIDDIIDLILSDLSAGNYYEAFDLFLSCVEDKYAYFQNSDYIDDYPNGEESLDARDILIRLGTAILIGAAIGGIVLLILRYRMNTVRAQSGAASYMVSGSYDLYRHSDYFLYSRVTRTKKPEPSSSGGGSRGGRSGKF